MISVRATITRLACFTALWWILAEGQTSMWRYALFAVPAATVVSLLTIPAAPSNGRYATRLIAAVQLLGWFLARSVSGAWDVSLRALRKPVDIDPVFIHYELRVPVGWARVALIDLMNLMPGSLSVEVIDHTVTFHVLDETMPVVEQAENLERLIMAVAGIELTHRR